MAAALRKKISRPFKNKVKGLRQKLSDVPVWKQGAGIIIGLLPWLSASVGWYIHANFNKLLQK